MRPPPGAPPAPPAGVPFPGAPPAPPAATATVGGPPRAATPEASAARDASATPAELARLAYDKRTGEEIDTLIRMIQPEQLPGIQATDAFTPQQKEQLMAIIKTRIECQAACSGG